MALGSPGAPGTGHVPQVTGWGDRTLYKRAFCFQKQAPLVLAGWLSWLEHCPVYPKVTGSIPGWGTHLSFGFDPWLGHEWEAVSLSPFLSKISEHLLG